jgi:hypothetical protein
MSHETGRDDLSYGMNFDKSGEIIADIETLFPGRI